MRKTAALICLCFACFSCKFVPFYAPDGSKLIITTNRQSMDLNGDKALITIIGFSGTGESLRDHTRVLLWANLGELPPYVDLMEGRAEAEFISGDESGEANIEARSGNISAGPVIIQVGPGKLDKLIIQANPGRLKPGGGTSEIKVFAYDEDDNPLQGIAVHLSTTSGSFHIQTSPQMTNSQGYIRNVLETSKSAKVTATAGSIQEEVNIEVETGSAPTAQFTYSPANPSKADKIYFNGSLSKDTDGFIVSYFWDYGDGDHGSGKTPEPKNYSWSGNYDMEFKVVLTVTDNDGQTGSTSQSVKVKYSNTLPVADFSYSPSSPHVNAEVTFNGSASYVRVSGRTIDEYIWDFGDDTPLVSNLEQKHTYTKAGTYAVKLKVKDSANEEGEIIKQITVTTSTAP